jgi:multidrug efflux pump subunit AcrB
MAQVLVQNRVNLAIPSLPDVIKAAGVTTLKRSPDILMGIAVNSPKGRYNQLYLSNMALRRVKDELARVDGVGDVFLFGQRDYSMRIWLDPGKLAHRKLTPTDLVAAIRDQNAQVATGMIGQPGGYVPTNGHSPATNGNGKVASQSAALSEKSTGWLQETQVPFDILGRLKEVERRRTAASFGSNMSRASNSAPRTKTSTRFWTVAQPCSWPSSNCPTPMRWTHVIAFWPSWLN